MVKLPALPEVLCHTYSMDSNYTAEQMREYGQQCRADALEEAAKLCESLACTDDHDSTITRLECAEKIRSLK